MTHKEWDKLHTILYQSKTCSKISTFFSSDLEKHVLRSISSSLTVLKREVPPGGVHVKINTNAFCTGIG